MCLNAFLQQIIYLLCSKIPKILHEGIILMYSIFDRNHQEDYMKIYN